MLNKQKGLKNLLGLKVQVHGGIKKKEQQQGIPTDQQVQVHHILGGGFCGVGSDGRAICTPRLCRWVVKWLFGKSWNSPLHPLRNGYLMWWR